MLHEMQFCSMFFMLKGLTAFFSVLVASDAPSGGQKTAPNGNARANDDGGVSGADGGTAATTTDAPQKPGEGQWHPTTMTLLWNRVYFLVYFSSNHVMLILYLGLSLHPFSLACCSQNEHNM